MTRIRKKRWIQNGKIKNHIRISPGGVDYFYRNIKEIKKTGCWEWQRYIMKNGYGVVHFNNTAVYAHRFSFALHKKEPKKFVCHKCDNPKCVNPDHLFEGTALDNSKDKIKKGKGNRGEKNPNSKLNYDKVLAIKIILKSNRFTEKSVGDLFSMSRTAIQSIKNKRSWGHVECS